LERHAIDPEYEFRPPRPSAFWAWALTPLRQRILRRMYRLSRIEHRGEDYLRRALDDAGNVMFAVNHPAHGDPFVILDVMHRLRVPCCYLAAWQVFTGFAGLKGFAFQRLGAFSIDREGTDLRAFRTAVDVLSDSRRSLVIFPEGEVYHLSDRVTPMREGAAMIALTAAKRRAKAGMPPLRIVPCALRYRYLDDPSPSLHGVMERLERRIHWRPASETPLAERIYRYADAVLTLKEMEYLRERGAGTIPQRIARLSEHILRGIESKRLGRVADETIPVRVKNLRAAMLKDLSPAAATDEPGPSPGPDAPSADVRAAMQRDFDDLHLVTQMFSYPGDYVVERPTIERIAETLDKFEEDALGAHYAGSRVARRAMVSFGEPIEVGGDAAGGRGGSRDAAARLTTDIEHRLQQLLDSSARDQT
jgi:1-acyl-sn-glycerol-3-phosphate acyltransferase